MFSQNFIDFRPKTAPGIKFPCKDQIWARTHFGTGRYRYRAYYRYRIEQVADYPYRLEQVAYYRYRFQQGIALLIWIDTRIGIYWYRSIPNRIVIENIDTGSAQPIGCLGATRDGVTCDGVTCDAVTVMV